MGSSATSATVSFGRSTARISSLSTAHHEAGHAVAAVVLGIGLDRVSIVDDGDVSGRVVLSQEWPRYGQPFQHVAACIIMSQGKGLRSSKLPRQGCIPRHRLVPLPAPVPMPVPTLVVPGSSTVLRNSSLSHASG